MLHNTFCRRLAALVLTLAVAVSAVLPVFAVYPMPVQTATETEAVYLFNADTGKTILSQNADQQKYVASLTKLMTALLLVESGKDLNGEVTVPTDLTQEFKDIQNANGTTMGLRIGETVRRIDLLNAMLIVSANDAASVIAYDVGGSVLDFVKQMNARAQELGCTGTNFTCAHGRHLVSATVVISVWVSTSGRSAKLAKAQSNKSSHSAKRWSGVSQPRITSP